jgi:hypothetical protein
VLDANAATLRTALFPRSGILTTALPVVTGAGLVAVCAQVWIALPFTCSEVSIANRDAS